jgi:deoxyribodipyrimidine photo-lyase
MRPLVWLRADLRTEDNHALFNAGRAATRGIVAAFTICEQQWRQHDWADIKVEFILRNLACLAEGLKRLNIPLLIVRTPRFAGVPTALLKLAHQHCCDALCFNREYGVNEIRRDEAVTARFTADGLQVRAFDDETALPPSTLRTAQGNPYTVFTPFKRAWLDRVRESDAAATLPPTRRQPEPVCATDAIPERIAGFDLQRGLPELWPAGERVAARRLDAFIAQRLAGYNCGRDYPADDATSRLSPYLATGVISARTCLQAAIAANGGRLDGGHPGADTWISELIWREFYRHVLVSFPRVSMGRPFKLDTERLRWSRAEEDFLAWCEGRTGFPIVDAAMRQLSQTGWMHNRLRMIAAMFLTKDLFIDWRRGERWFMRRLVDGDLASNNGGWQWSASTGTDAVPYFRIFNPTSQSRKFDPDGEFIRTFVPELRPVAGPAIHAPPPKLRAELGYPAPICDHAAARRHVLAAFAELKHK